LADYATSYRLFQEEGVEVVAISVDPPETSAATRRSLAIGFPVLSDSNRETITRWGLLNANEKGGIAFPATFLIDRGRLVRFSTAEDTSRRVAADAMLTFAKRMGLEGDASAPPQSSINPGSMFVRAIANALRRGIRVKSG
jgi:peroxiredoxin